MLSVRHYTPEAIERITMAGKFFWNNEPEALSDLW